MADKAKQKRRIVEYCTTHDGITQQEANIAISVGRLPARIWDLRNDGYEFSEEWDKGVNQFGEKTRYMRYRLVKTPEVQA